MLNSNKHKKLQLFNYIIYLFLFFGVWSIYELLGKDMIDHYFTNIGAIVLKNVAKVLFWITFSMVLIKKYSFELEVPFPQLFKNKVKVRKVLPIFMIFTLYIVIGSFLERGSLYINESFCYSDLFGKFLFVGITEELVFRGWFLNVTLKKMNQWLAIIINSFLFLLIHFPVWIKSGILVSSFLSGSFLTVLILSVIFSYSFIKTRNIFVPILLHMYWDLLVILIW